MKVGGGGGERRKRTFLSSPPPSALLLTPFFASLTLVRRSLLLNRTEMLATQARKSLLCELGFNRTSETEVALLILKR